MILAILRREKRRGVVTMGCASSNWPGARPPSSSGAARRPRRQSSMQVGPGRSSCRPFGLPFGDSMISPVRLLWLAASAVGRRAGYTQRRVAWAIDLPFRFSPVLSIGLTRGSGARVPQMRFAQPSGPDRCSRIICRHGPSTSEGRFGGLKHEAL
jgi:hypothetical protein